MSSQWGRYNPTKYITTWERRCRAPGYFWGTINEIPLELGLHKRKAFFSNSKNYFQSENNLLNAANLSELVPRKCVRRHSHCHTLCSNFVEWVTSSPATFPFLLASFGSQVFKLFQSESIVCVPLMFDNPLGTLWIMEAYSLCWWLTWKHGIFNSLAALDHARAPSA